MIAGLAIGAGNGIAFLRLISSHGPLEISCIVVGGVAGLRIGWALIRPGVVRRGTSLRREARPAVEIAVGTVPWLVLCGFLEGFATGPDLPVAFQAALGFFLFVALLGARRVARAAELQHGPGLGPQVGGDERRGEPVRRRLEHAGARGPDQRRGASAGVEDVAGDRGASGAEGVGSPAATIASSAGSDGLPTITAWRRVSTGTARTSERAADSSSRSHRTTTSARFEPSARRNVSS